jgi:hypothetical protein
MAWKKDSKEWKGGYAWAPENYLRDKRWEEEKPAERVIEYTPHGIEVDPTDELHGFLMPLSKDDLAKVNAYYAPSLAKFRAEEQIELDRMTEAARLRPPVSAAPARPAIFVRLEEKAKAAASMPIVNDLQLDLTEDKKDK